MKFKTSYIICSTPRSGSTLLCDLLTATNEAGKPQSYFMSQFYAEWAEHLNVAMDGWASQQSFDQSYLKAVLKEGVGETQVFGLRLQRESLEGLSLRLKHFFPDSTSDKDRFKVAFGTKYYIYLSRRDKVAQAVSLLRAEQSGLWHINTDRTERERLKKGYAPMYDDKAITEMVATLEEQDVSWERWFYQQQIQPIKVVYEDLSTNFKTVLISILSKMGIDSSFAESAESKTAKMSDSESEGWVKRFRDSGVVD